MTRLHVLMINGGGLPATNVQAHLLHLKALRETLLGAGVAPERITVFSGDGADPDPDLAMREAEPEPDFFLLRGTRQERALGAPKVLVNSEIPGVTLRTAGKAEITAWFEQARTALKPGDTLLLYVTDHGLQDAADPMNNSILLWKRDKLTVRELGKLLDVLDPGVRVVGLMSQCYSGAFAALAGRPSEDGRPHAPFCGYFAAPADRPAYGCFAEDRSRDRAGHAFQIIHALGARRSLAEAHDDVLVSDDAPDAPLKSSDAYLEALLKKTAHERGIAVEALVDELLGAAWRDDPAAARERALVDRIGAAFDVGAPRTFAEIAQKRKELPELEHGFDASNKAWRAAWIDAAVDNAKGFFASNASWSERAGDAAIKGMDPTAARALAAPLLADLRAYTTKEQRDRIALYHDRAEAASGALFRTEVRVSAAIRMRTLLATVAGRALLARGAPADRAAFEAIRSCEDLHLAGAPPPPAAEPPRAPFPALAEDRELERTLRPAWTGLVFNDVPPDLRKQKQLPDGAAAVGNVYPDSPAAAAGLDVGDILLGPPGHPFGTHNEVRAWALLSPAGAPAPLEVLRAGGDRASVSIVPRPLPLTLPPLPAALTVGRTAPALDFKAYRGDKAALANGKPHLLMFWATWCKPCKTALPELLAFEREKKTQVIAVTDEDAEALDAFFKKFGSPFPKTVAIDELHRGFDAFGVKSRPLFVLLDGKGTVVARTAGYEKGKGLGIEGWKWKGR
jgi:thiol-disulfide isomerase/thioredoxin